MVSTNPNDLDNVKKALGEPVFIQTNEDVAKSRRALMFLTFLTLAYKLSGAEIDSFEPAGVAFKNFNLLDVDIVLFGLIFYHFVHFVWKSLDELLEWRIRLTGSKLAYITTARFADDYSDYPNDPRQSSLMTWWTEEAPKIGNIKDILQAISEISKELHEQASSEECRQWPNINHITTQTSNLQSELAQLKQRLKSMEETLTSPRISESLTRFEQWYRYFGHSQLARFIILEWFIPIVMTLWAMYLVKPWQFG